MSRTSIAWVVAAFTIAGCSKPVPLPPNSSLVGTKSVEHHDNQGNLIQGDMRCGKKANADYGDCTFPVMVLWESDTKCWSVLPYNKLSVYLAGMAQKKVEWYIVGHKDSVFTALAVWDKQLSRPDGQQNNVWNPDDSDRKKYKVVLKNGAPPNTELKHELKVKTKDSSGNDVDCEPIDPLIVNVE